jgi:hypothetical protein
MSGNQAPNLPFPAGTVSIPSWLAGVFAVCETHRGFLARFSEGWSPAGLGFQDLEILPYLIDHWGSSIAVSGNQTAELDVEKIACLLPPHLGERLPGFCSSLFGLRLVPDLENSSDEASLACRPFFIGESLLKSRSGVISGRRLQLAAGMADVLLGRAGASNPAFLLPAALWASLDAEERSWLLVIEAAARWDFSWVRADGCVQLDLENIPGRSLGDTIKVLAGLGRQMLLHGLISGSVDDRPVLFHRAAGDVASRIRILWSLNPARAEITMGVEPVRVSPQVSLDAAKPEDSPVISDHGSGAWQAKMRLVAADELRKMRAGGTGQYQSLRQKYFESLDAAGRRMILDMQQRLAPEVFDTHLGHVLVRYMIEHPSAWQSAAPVKSTH